VLKLGLKFKIRRRAKERMINFKKFGEVENQPFGVNQAGDLTVSQELKI
jgi:hypothetical protein